MSVQKKYQIFVSSTFDDLKEAREKVLQGILKMQHIPVGMEMFAADGRDQWETIRKFIDECDYYIVIIGHRYGTLSKENISYTEKEYWYAKKKKIPVMAFIQTDDVSLKISVLEMDKNKQEMLQKFKEEVKGGLCDFWGNSDELVANVVTALNRAFHDQPRRGWIRPKEQEIKEQENIIKELRKENQELNKRIDSLQKKLERCPKLELRLENCYFSYYNPPKTIIDYDLECQKLRMEMVPKKLQKYISQEMLDDYNDKLPSKETVATFNYNMCLFCAHEERTYEPFLLCVENIGTQPANNIRLQISIPNGVLLLRRWTIEHQKQPNQIMPMNPIRKAELRNKIEQSKYTSGLDLQPKCRVVPVYEKFDEIDPQILYQDRIWHIWESKDEITVRIDNLQQEGVFSLAEELVLVSIEKGEFKIPIQVICDEYPKSEIHEIVISVEDED